MAIRFYDEALYNKIQKWVKEPNMKILKPDEMTRLVQIQADENNDNPIKLPLIGLSRASEVEIINPTKRPMTFDGKMLDADEAKTIQLNAIPISLNYQLDILTRTYEEGDEYLRNFIFNFVNHPMLNITIPYNDVNIKHNARTRLNTTVRDNSDIELRLYSGQFTR